MTAPLSFRKEAKVKVETFVAQVLARWKGRRIDKFSQAQEVADTLVTLKAEQKGLRNTMETILRPMRETLAARRDEFKPLVDGLVEAEAALKEAWGTWVVYQEKAKKAEEAKAAAAQEISERTGTPIEVHTSPTPARVQPVAGRIAPVLIWTWELEDLSKVPTKFLAVDSGAVTNAVRAGSRKIPGIRVFQKSVLKAGR